MKNYTIIEDCSPYYIRFTWDGLSDLIALCNTYPFPERNEFNFRHHRIPDNFRIKIMERLPMCNRIPFNIKRFSFFISEPGLYYGAHKDSIDHRFSLNIPIMILDDKCVTSWYSDDDLKEYTITTSERPSLDPSFIVPANTASREILNWDRTKHQAIKTMVARPNEAILFNTDIFHAWDNGGSDKRRIVLTLRHENPANVYFDDVKKILFEL
jgi:hypothetical protein